MPATGCSGTSTAPTRSSRSTPLSLMISTTTSVAPRQIWPATRPNTIVPSCSRISKVGNKIRALAFAPLYAAGWAIVAGAVVMRALTGGDKPRQEKEWRSSATGLHYRSNREPRWAHDSRLSSTRMTHRVFVTPGDRHHSEQEPRHSRWQPFRQGKDRKDRTDQDGPRSGKERGRRKVVLFSS